MGLNEQQLSYIDTFGFLKFPGLFADEINDISIAFEQVWTDIGMAHNYRSHTLKAKFVEQSTYLSQLIEEPRIAAMARSILGDDYKYHGSDGHIFVGDTKWHGDKYPYPRYRLVRFAFYLDPITRDTGCLSVIPGTCHPGDEFTDAVHKVVPLTKESRPEEFWGIPGNEVPSVALETRPGDVLVVNVDTKHSTWGGGNRRRMFSLLYTDRQD